MLRGGDLQLTMMTPEGVTVLGGERGDGLPLIINAQGDNTSVEFLVNWVANNKTWLDDMMLKHGEYIDLSLIINICLYMLC